MWLYIIFVNAWQNYWWKKYILCNLLWSQFQFASNVYLPLSPLSRLLIVFFLSANNANENNKQAREVDHSWTADNWQLSTPKKFLTRIVVKFDRLHAVAQEVCHQLCCSLQNKRRKTSMIWFFTARKNIKAGKGSFFKGVLRSKKIKCTNWRFEVVGITVTDEMLNAAFSTWTTTNWKMLKEKRMFRICTQSKKVLVKYNTK